MDALDKFKQNQREGWAHFGPLESSRHRRPHSSFVSPASGPETACSTSACGTGVVAVTAARRGARVTGLDLTPELLERARENAAIAKVTVDFHEGDVETLPFDDSEFDVVLSQFGHMFAPRPEIAIAEMLRVLRPGGTIAFSTWPAEMVIGRMFALAAKYAPPPPPGVSPPPLWGDPDIIRDRLGDRRERPAFRPRHDGRAGSQPAASARDGRAHRSDAKAGRDAGCHRCRESSKRSGASTKRLVE